MIYASVLCFFFFLTSIVSNLVLFCIFRYFFSKLFVYVKKKLYLCIRKQTSTKTTFIMENKSQQLNENLRSLYEEMKANLCKVLNEQPNHTICFDNREKDTIYGYFYDGDGKLIEQQVKGVQLGMYGIIYVCLDIDAIQYTIEDLLDDDKTPEDLWYALEELLGYYTLMNINEVLHEYI